MQGSRFQKPEPISHFENSRSVERHYQIFIFPNAHIRTHNEPIAPSGRPEYCSLHALFSPARRAIRNLRLLFERRRAGSRKQQRRGRRQCRGFERRRQRGRGQQRGGRSKCWERRGRRNDRRRGQCRERRQRRERGQRGRLRRRHVVASREEHEPSTGTCKTRRQTTARASAPMISTAGATTRQR